MFRWTIVAAAAVMLLAAPLSAQYIGIFQDVNATTCAANPGPAPWIDLHVIAVLEAGVTELHGAGFRVTGAPAGWTTENAVWVPEPGSGASAGHPLFGSTGHSDQGVHVPFGTCREVEGSGRVLLGRIVLLGAPTPPNVRLRVEGAATGTNPPCPRFVRCDGRFTQMCVAGGEFVLNGAAPPACQVAIEASTWSTLKTLYR